jgi:hypothetical protein
MNQRRYEPDPHDLGTIHERLDTIEQNQQALMQELHTVSDTWLETLQEHYTEHKNAIAELKTLIMQLLQQKGE